MVIFSIDEWIRHNELETQHWHEWFKRNPGALEVPMDIAQTKNVRELILHIVAVDRRYAERLSEKEVTPYENLSMELDDLFAVATESFAQLRKYAQQAGQEDLRKEVTFPTRTAGTLKSTKRRILIHTLMHSVRHWAQLATELRKAGYKTDWQHDLLYSEVIE